MTRHVSGQLRGSQVITTYGPGSLLDLPYDSAIVSGLESWGNPAKLPKVEEPRLARKLQMIAGLANRPGLYAPPPAPELPWEKGPTIGARRFPEWFLSQPVTKDSGSSRTRERKLVHRRVLDDKLKLDGDRVVPIRFVRACPRGHIADINWRWFVHGSDDTCNRPLWVIEQGQGDLGEIRVRCECGKGRNLADALDLSKHALGSCFGDRPWLGGSHNEECGLPARLLTRTASNAYFSQVVSVLSLPDRGSEITKVVNQLWDDLSIVDDAAGLAFIKKKPHIAEALASWDDAEVLKAIDDARKGGLDMRPVKLVELDAILSAQEGYGDDQPVDPNFHARRLPGKAWRGSSTSGPVKAIYQLHRLREVLALAGFTRFEAIVPDINGEYDSDVEPAALAIDPTWFPAVENRGEGIFIELRADAVGEWIGRESVQERLHSLVEGQTKWNEDRNTDRPFPTGPYVLLHTLSHLLIQSLSLRCGYPTSSIRERVYADLAENRFGLLLYTASPDSEGTLGGLVQQARHIESHLSHAFRLGSLCSNDPICAQHNPATSLEERWLHGAACHGCTLVPETCCEMRNEYLDRALVVPVLGCEDAAFFEAQG